MRLRIQHDFDGIDAAAYETLYFDELFNRELSTSLHMGRELLRLDRTTDRIVRHVRYEPKRDSASPANQVFGASRASFVEELDYDVRARRGAWRTIPNQFADRVRNTGTIELVDIPNGVRRIVDGDVKVSLFGFGRLVERAIVAEIDKSYAATTAFTLAWLAR